MFIQRHGELMQAWAAAQHKEENLTQQLGTYRAKFHSSGVSVVTSTIQTPGDTLLQSARKSA